MIQRVILIIAMKFVPHVIISINLIITNTHAQKNAKINIIIQFYQKRNVLAIVQRKIDFWLNLMIFA